MGTKGIARKTVSGFDAESQDKARNRRSRVRPEARGLECGIRNGSQDFPGGTVVKSLTANAGDTGSSPGLGGSHMPRSN